MTVKNKAIKFISALLIIAIIAPAILFSTPERARAQVPPVPVTEAGPHGWISKFFLGSTSASNATNTAISVKNVALEVLRQSIMVIVRGLLQKMTQATVKWINSGFHGAPLFVQNPESFFGDIAKYEVRNFVNLIGYDIYQPFGKDIALNTINAYKRKFEDNARYTLSKVVDDPVLLNNYRNNFNVGGWNGFLINTQYPQNNYLGYQLLATKQLASKVRGTTQNAAQKVRTTLNQGMGFLSPKACPSNPSYNNGTNEFLKPAFHPTVTLQEPDPNNPDQEQALADAQKEYYEAVDNEKFTWEQTNECPGGLVATTPGSVVANQITNALGSTFRQGELGAALGNSISAILDALLAQLTNLALKGLTSLGGATNQAPPTDNWSYEGNTLDSSGGTSANWSGGIDFNNPTTQTSSINVGSTTNITMSGGIGPYSIQTPPDTTIANVSIDNGNTLTITGVKAGSTLVVVKDSSTPEEKTVTVQIIINAIEGSTFDFNNPPPQNIFNISIGVVGIDVAGDLVNITLTGGVTDYSIEKNSDSAIAISYVSGTTLTIAGVAPGKTSVVIKDSSSPAKTITVNIAVGNESKLVVPESVSVNAGGTTNITISGGTTPYSIKTQPDMNIASVYVLDNTTLMVVGADAPGQQTSFVIEDSYSPSQTATVQIIVTAPLGTCTSGVTITNNVTQTECLSVDGSTWVENQP